MIAGGRINSSRGEVSLERGWGRPRFDDGGPRGSESRLLHHGGTCIHTAKGAPRHYQPCPYFDVRIGRC